MFRLICHSLCAVFIAIAFSVLAAPGTVGLSQPAQDPKKQSKQEREYQKIKQFSEKLYAEDALFREEVDESYRQKRREHSELAYFTNTRDSQDDQDTRTGDKLKVEDTLYDNPLVQDYVNRVGQLIVPKDSKKLYGFKVTLNPIPEARALSTGTIYISSGLLSMIDNEAQLAYVLGHEVAHVEKDHWREDVVVERGIHRYYEKQEKKRRLKFLASLRGESVVELGTSTRTVTSSRMDLNSGISGESSPPTGEPYSTRHPFDKVDR